MKEFIVDGIEELNEISKYLTQIKDSKVFFLKGNLGAGKTTFVQHICSNLGVKDQVVSPSFALINIYNSNFGEIYHIDLYRLNDIEEAIDLGIEDYLYSNNYCFIEWPELIANIAPEVYYEININILEDSKRKIVILKKAN